MAMCRFLQNISEISGWLRFKAQFNQATELHRSHPNTTAASSFHRFENGRAFSGRPLKPPLGVWRSQSHQPRRSTSTWGAV